MPLQTALEALKRKDFAAALALMAREDERNFGVSHFLIKGLSESALKDWAAALATFTAASLRFPDYALFWLNRGIAEENLHLPEAAITSHERCLALNPLQAEACGNLSNLYRNTRRGVEASVAAEAMARRALALGADQGDALNCLALALEKQGKVDEAREVFLQAHQAAPDKALILANHANLETNIFNFAAAWPLFAAARAISDDAVFRHDEGLARLLSGDSERGFALFEARLENPEALRIRPSCPRWQGESLKGKKLLIVAEQGFGDVIHFCRYESCLPEGDLVWAVPKNLVRLLKPSLRGEVLDETAPLPACDYYVPMMSLGLLNSVPLEGIYLSAPATPLLPKGSHPLKIGIVWAGSKTHRRDDERSIPLKLFAPILESVPADFYAPLLGEALEEIGDLPITRLDSLLTDFADTAALLHQMDCLITVDTAVAHLAGALGVKTFMLLPLCPDWRWGVTGDTTPPYPSMTLVRQQTHGDWSSAIDKVLAFVKTL